MVKFSVNVMGVDYDCYVGTRAEVLLVDPTFPEEFAGECHRYTKRIFAVWDESTRVGALEKMRIMLEVLTHELVHAFAFESGIDVDGNFNEEDLACWMSRILPTLISVREEVIRILEGERSVEC